MAHTGKVVTYNAANIKSFMKKYIKFVHVSCVAHGLLISDEKVKKLKLI